MFGIDQKRASRIFFKLILLVVVFVVMDSIWNQLGVHALDFLCWHKDVAKVHFVRIISCQHFGFYFRALLHDFFDRPLQYLPSDLVVISKC
jgi:hypothetical protein